MDKYLKAIESVKRLAEFLEGSGAEAYRIYKMVDHRLGGVEEVAIYDVAISREDFLNIQKVRAYLEIFNMEDIIWDLVDLYNNVGDIYNVPISHGEGRFLASEELIRKLAENGQIATQYVDLEGNATADIDFNPNDSMFAIEGITSPDGRVFGKMGHSERIGDGLYKNVEGNYDIHMFKAAVKYFK